MTFRRLSSRRGPALLAVGAALAVPASSRAEPPPAPAPQGASAEPAAASLSDRQVVGHALNRLAFGPTPGQVDRVQAGTWQAWVREQLDPELIEDSELDAVLHERSPSLSMSMGRIFKQYKPPYADEDKPTVAEKRERARLRGKLRRELQSAVLLRAIASRRQFKEVIVEFWRNHFNVDLNKKGLPYLVGHYEEQVIRKHAFGRFGDMLMASAKHPAMLIYLDNALSQKPLTDEEEMRVARRGRRRATLSLAVLLRQRGLNENYARELMELHTLGVEHENRKGGYSQRDVIEIARALTGWTVGFSEDKEDYGFVFNPAVHDNLPKTVFGKRLGNKRGMGEGELIFRRLSGDRRTARFISRKLCRYLVNDDPPEKLVKRVSRVFQSSRGHLPKVYEAIIFSPEFVDAQNYQAKFKTPFEFTVSAVRATDASVGRYGTLLSGLAMMGQPIYEMDDPTGYYDQAEAWLDPGVLLHRWHVAITMGEGHLDGVSLDSEFVGDLVNLPPDEMKQRMIKQLLPAGVDDQTDRVLDEAMESFGLYRRQVLGLLLGSPAFQQQ